MSKSQKRVERMRRHQARDTPDRVTRSFNWEDTDEGLHLQWMDDFRDSMVVKHGEDKVREIVATVDDSLARYPGQTVLSLEVRLR